MHFIDFTSNEWKPQNHKAFYIRLQCVNHIHYKMMAIVHCIETELYFVKLHIQFAFKFKFKTILKQSKIYLAMPVCVYVCVDHQLLRLQHTHLIRNRFYILRKWMYIQYCGFGVNCNGFRRQSEDENDFFFSIFLGLRCGFNPVSHIKFDIYLKWTMGNGF